MKNKFHGVFSFVLIFTALGIATYFLIQDTNFGWYYLAYVVIGFTGIAGIFCTKCAAAPNNCSHVFIGYLTKIFPQRKNNEYKLWEYSAVGAILLVMVGVPQYWLWKHLFFFIAFWTLLILAGMEINAFVCKKCLNKKCAMCKP